MEPVFMLNSQVLVEQCKACLGRAKGLKLAPLVAMRIKLTNMLSIFADSLGQ